MKPSHRSTRVIVSGTVAVGATVLMLCAPLAANAQTIVNGTFDTSLAGWSTNTSNIIWDSANGNPGGNAIINDVGSSPFDPILSQTITGLTSGATYRITGDHAVHVEITPVANSFGASIDGVFFYQDALTPAQGYQPFAFNFTATSPTAVLGLVAERNGSDVSYRVDNVGISIVSSGAPEPGSLALAGIGLAPLAGLLARRRRA